MSACKHAEEISNGDMFYDDSEKPIEFTCACGHFGNAGALLGCKSKRLDMCTETMWCPVCMTAAWEYA